MRSPSASGGRSRRSVIKRDRRKTEARSHTACSSARDPDVQAQRGVHVDWSTATGRRRPGPGLRSARALRTGFRSPRGEGSLPRACRLGAGQEPRLHDEVGDSAIDAASTSRRRRRTTAPHRAATFPEDHEEHGASRGSPGARCSTSIARGSRRTREGSCSPRPARCGCRAHCSTPPSARGCARCLGAEFDQVTVRPDAGIRGEIAGVETSLASPWKPSGRDGNGFAQISSPTFALPGMGAACTSSPRLLHWLSPA